MIRFLCIIFFIITTTVFGNTIGFEANFGQIKDQNNNVNQAVIYSLKLENFNINLKRDGFSYDFYEKFHEEIKTHRLDFKFKGFNPYYKIEYGNKIDYYENIILNDKEHTILFYQKITYKNFYPNIDLEFYVNDNNDKPFEYNFILHPGADINTIKFETTGAQTILNANQLKFKLRFGELIESLPKSWIQYPKDTKEVKIEYCYHNDGSIGLQSDLNITNQKVIIDPLPIRKWGSYLSKYTRSSLHSTNHILLIEKVKFFKSDIYIYGTTDQKNLATTGAFQTTIVNFLQPFVAKFDSNGNRIWLTYFGSKGGEEYAQAIDIDNAGNIYLGSTVSGNNFSTPNAYQPQRGGNIDMHLAKLDSNGKRIWATYYGGNDFDNLNSLVIDKQEQVIYIAGSTMSTDLKHPSNAILTTNTNNVFKPAGLIAKFNLDGEYQWSSYSYGSISSIAIDHNHQLIISETKGDSQQNSPQFLHTTGGKSLSKYDNNLKHIWTRQILNDYNNILKIGIDSNNNIFLTGLTNVDKGISYGNSYSPTFEFDGSNGHAGFLKKYTSDGTEVFGTFIGKEGRSSINDLVIGDKNEIIISGSSTSNHIYDGENHFQSNAKNVTKIEGNGNALLMKFDTNGNPIWGFLYGDKAYGSRYYGVDYNFSTKDIIAVGETSSPYMIATPNAFQTKPIYDHEQNNLVGINGILTLYSDVENNFKITKIGNDCDIHSLEYTASGANKYTWYDLEGNIVANDATFTPSTIGEYICKFDDGKNIGYISIIVTQRNIAQAPIPIVEDLPLIKAYCHVALTPPIALSGCGEEIIGITPQTNFDTPGNYRITWTYTDQIGNTTTQEQQVEVLPADNFIPDNLSLSLCEEDTDPIFNLKLIENDLPKASYKYYASLLDLQNNIEIENPEQYIYNASQPNFYIRGTLENGCESSNRIDLNIESRPQINELQINLCDAQNMGYVNYDLTLLQNKISSNEVKFYFDAKYQTQITHPINITNNQIIYTKATNQKGCTSYSLINFTLSNYTLIETTPISICKDIHTIGEYNLVNKANELAQIEQINSSQVVFYETLNDALQNQNNIDLNYTNTNQLTEIYATIISSDACKTFYKIPLVEYINPIIHLSDQFFKCKNESILIKLNESYDEIMWSNGMIGQSAEFTQAGNYEVIVTNGNCSITKSFEIQDYSDLQFDYTYDGSTVTFKFLNDLNAKVSLDQTNWSQQIFKLEPNQYTFYFKASTGCIEEHTIYLYKDLPTFISPNGDGINDEWDFSYVKDLKSLHIYDRFGKLVFHKTKNDPTLQWNGKLNGKTLPSGSYWYTITFENGNIIEGHILLKNK